MTNLAVDVPLLVRYAETDQMGRAYYANYLVWFEVARTEFCKARGFRYSDLESETGTFLPVVETSCRYVRPLHYDESFIVRTRVTLFRSRAIRFGYEVLSPDGRQLFAEGMTHHIFVDREGKAKRFPAEYVRFFEGICEERRDA
jgi:acyl-CoA thioester hydrolase